MTIYSPLHHTVPLLAAKLVRHEDRIDAIIDTLNDFLREHIETLTDEVENLVIGQLAMKVVFEQTGIRLEEAIEFIGALCGANTTMEIMVGTMDRELDKINTQNMHLRHALQESQAGKKVRDQAIEAMSAAIQELQHRMDKAPGKP
jgi:hypothetical protein